MHPSPSLWKTFFVRSTRIPPRPTCAYTVGNLHGSMIQPPVFLFYDKSERSAAELLDTPPRAARWVSPWVSLTSTVELAHHTVDR